MFIENDKIFKICDKKNKKFDKKKLIKKYVQQQTEKKSKFISI